jgi:hypothetical protein
MGVFAPSFTPRLAQAASLFPAILSGIIIFALVLFLVGGVREEDLKSVPRLGDTLLKLARKFNLLRR